MDAYNDPAQVFVRFMHIRHLAHLETVNQNCIRNGKAAYCGKYCIQRIASFGEVSAFQVIEAQYQYYDSYCSQRANFGFIRNFHYQEFGEGSRISQLRRMCNAIKKSYPYQNNNNN